MLVLPSILVPFVTNRIGCQNTKVEKKDAIIEQISGSGEHFQFLPRRWGGGDFHKWVWAHGYMRPI